MPWIARPPPRIFLPRIVDFEGLGLYAGGLGLYAGFGLTKYVFQSMFFSFSPSLVFNTP